MKQATPPRLFVGVAFFMGGKAVHRLLVIDNYDSFTFNLVQMFRRYALDIRVFRSDRISLEQVDALSPDYVLISPGPKDPAHAGISISLIREFHTRLPIFGVCLGMQCMNEAFGGETVRAPVPMHGKTSTVEHTGRGLFRGVAADFRAARYHSLMVQLPEAAGASPLEVTAWSDDGVVMGLSHPTCPLHGVQFHPESFLTDHGPVLVENFLALGPLEPRRQPAGDGRFLVEPWKVETYACA
jgi:anthranilate synthase component 2